MRRLVSKLVIVLSLGSVVLARPAAATALVDLVTGVLFYNAVNTIPPVVANTLTISLAGGVYTIDDPAESTLDLGPGALGQGCAPYDSNTITCPAAAIAGFDVDTNDGQDSIVLTGVPVPANIDGGVSADTIVGGSAGDTIVWTPGGGSDVIDGGPGSDTLRFFGSNIAEVFKITAEGAGFALTRNIGAVDLGAESIELLDLATLAGADDVSTTPLANTAQQLKSGTDAEPDTLRIDADGRCLVREGDTFEVPGFGSILIAHFATVLVGDLFCRVDPCDGAVATMGCTVNGAHGQVCQGTDANDVIIGSVAADVIIGGGGSDRIRGGAGDDLLCGGEGEDGITGGRDADTIAGGPGADRLRGDSGNDIVLGGDDGDKLVGGSGADDLDGGLGDDSLVAGSGDDTLRGGDGLDLVKGGGGTDTCTDTDQSGPFSGCDLP